MCDHSVGQKVFAKGEYRVIRLNGDTHRISRADLGKDPSDTPITIRDILRFMESRVDIPCRYLELSRVSGSDILPRDTVLSE